MLPRSVGEEQFNCRGGRVLLEAKQVRRPLHRHSKLRESIDEEKFVLILREDEHERKRAEPRPGVLERNRRRLSAARPQIDAADFDAALHDVIREIAHLLIELERPRLDTERSRERPTMRTGSIHSALALTPVLWRRRR